jgi:hypothetical protein
MNGANRIHSNVRGVVRMVFAITAVVLLASCAASVVKTEAPQRPARSVLIVTGVGMVPAAANDPRYEKTWLEVAGKYADGLNEATKAAGVQTQVHIRRDRNEALDATVAMLVAKDKKDALVQVTVNHVRTSADNTIYLKAELMSLEYVYYSDGTRKAVTRKGAEKSYPILSTTKPDMSKASLSDLAQQFVKELRAQGHL